VRSGATIEPAIACGFERGPNDIKVDSSDEALAPITDHPQPLG